MGILDSNFVGQGKNLRQALGFDSRISACFFQRGKNLFGGDVADQIVSSKGTAPESGERAVKAAASRFVRRHNFLFRIFWTTVQVHAEFDSRHVVLYLAVKIADEFSVGGSDGVGERDGAHAN